MRPGATRSLGMVATVSAEGSVMEPATEAFGEATASTAEGLIFLDVAQDGFGCGVCLLLSDARNFYAELGRAIEECSHVQG